MSSSSLVPRRGRSPKSSPEAVAAAVIEFITGSLLVNPRRVGRALRNELAGIFSARRGTFRVLYRIDEDHHEVVVLRVEHRRDITEPDRLRRHRATRGSACRVSCRHRGLRHADDRLSTHVSERVRREIVSLVKPLDAVDSLPKEPGEDVGWRITRGSRSSGTAGDASRNPSKLSGNARLLRDVDTTRGCRDAPDLGGS